MSPAPSDRPAAPAVRERPVGTAAANGAATPSRATGRVQPLGGGRPAAAVDAGRGESPQGPLRPAFYALGHGRIRDVLTLLHPPYTAWHLSYFAIGAAVAAHLYVNRLLWGLAAFGLAVGIAAHALDELHDRPLGTSLSDRTLIVLAVTSLLGALAIGVAGIVTVSVWLAPLVLAGGLFLPAYNLELADGRFHSDLWFAVGWGAFPAFTGYFANAGKVALPGLLIAGGCLAMSVAQRRLSSPARELRRRTRAIRGVRVRSDGRSEELSLSGLLAPLDGALAALSLSVVVTACALVASRL
jgi:hypothetical protein